MAGEHEPAGGKTRSHGYPFLPVMYRLPSQPLEKLRDTLGGGFRDHEWNPSWRVGSGVSDPPYLYPERVWPRRESPPRNNNMTTWAVTTCLADRSRWIVLVDGFTGVVPRFGRPVVGGVRWTGRRVDWEGCWALIRWIDEGDIGWGLIWWGWQDCHLFFNDKMADCSWPCTGDYWDAFVLITVLIFNNRTAQYDATCTGWRGRIFLYF